MILVRLRSALIVIVIVAAMATPALLVALRASQGAAEFSDDVTIGRNQVSAATVDIEIGEMTVPIVAPDLAPGDVRTGSIELVNDGTVPLRFSTRGGLVGAENRELASYLTWRVFWSPLASSCPTMAPVDAVTVGGAALAAGGSLTGNSAAGGDEGDRILQVGERDLLCLEVEFSIEAPNSVQATTLVQPIIADAEQLLDDDPTDGVDR